MSCAWTSKPNAIIGRPTVINNNNCSMIFILFFQFIYNECNKKELKIIKRMTTTHALIFNLIRKTKSRGQIEISVSLPFGFAKKMILFVVVIVWCTIYWFCTQLCARDKRMEECIGQFFGPPTYQIFGNIFNYFTTDLRGINHIILSFPIFSIN